MTFWRWRRFSKPASAAAADVAREQARWDAYATADPLWAVLSDPARRDRRWTLDSFFETGVREISLALHRVGQLGWSPGRRRALDFGCGVGRLTQALAAHFQRVVGVDVSPAMVAHAQALNRQGARVTYVQNGAADLAAFEDGAFDFVYSDIVLQHLPPDMALGYVREFFRVLAPGGVAMFQLPSHRRPAGERDYAPASMEAGAYAAEVTIVDGVASAAPGARQEIAIAVRNAGTVAWDQAQFGIFRVGNHWRSADGLEMLVQDDGRVSLPPTLTAGTRCVVALPITMPETPGVYTCEIDVVHEGITWFGDRGSATAQCPVAVGTADAARDVESRSGRPASEPRPGPVTSGLTDEEFYRRLPPAGTPPAPFPMHGVAEDTIRGLERHHPVRLLQQEIDERCGSEWVGYRYVFVRPA